ncbi:MAG: hypothetical protein IIC95_10210, partial [Chloroflexi bacterium]|nr:hypothetical protein [Chloroflexota bacterium]
MIIRKIEKTISIALFTVAFLAGSVLLPYTSIFALASKQPGFDMQVRNVSDGENFAGNPTSVSLEAGEVAQMRMQINNPEKGNDIDSLRVKAFFNADANPNKFHTAVKADNLDWIGAEVSVSVPTGYFLEYVSGSTVIDLDDRPEFMTRTNIDDINGTTPLAFADGYEVTNLKGGPNTWMWVYFKVKATETKPTVINPRLDLEKVVANTSKGQTLKEDRTSTTASTGDTISCQ